MITSPSSFYPTHLTIEPVEVPMPARRKSKTSPLPSRTCRIAQAAAYTGFSPWSLRKAVHGGQLKIVRMSDGYRGPWLFDIKDLDEFIENRKAFA